MGNPIETKLLLLGMHGIQAEIGMVEPLHLGLVEFGNTPHCTTLGLLLESSEPHSLYLLNKNTLLTSSFHLPASETYDSEVAIIKL